MRIFTTAFGSIRSMVNALANLAAHHLLISAAVLGVAFVISAAVTIRQNRRDMRDALAMVDDLDSARRVEMFEYEQRAA